MTGRPRVLIVEEDDAVRSFVRAVLLGAGLDVTTVPDGRAGLDRFEAEPGAYQLVVTDIERRMI